MILLAVDFLVRMCSSILLDNWYLPMDEYDARDPGCTYPPASTKRNVHSTNNKKAHIYIYVGIYVQRFCTIKTKLKARNPVAPVLKKSYRTMTAPR